MKTDLNFFNVDTLACYEQFRNYFLGETRPFVNYFVKTKPNEYHKIVIPAQHLYKYVA